MEKFLKSLFRATGAKTEAEIQRRFRRLERSTVNRRLRSCCLELRADDGRLRGWFERPAWPVERQRPARPVGHAAKTTATTKQPARPGGHAAKITATTKRPADGAGVGERGTATAKRLQLKITAEVVREMHRPVEIPADGFTVGEAAKAFGVSRPTINRWIKKGSLSARGTKRDRRVFRPAGKTKAPPGGEPWMEAMVAKARELGGGKRLRSTGRPTEIRRIHFDMPEPELPADFEQTLDVVERGVHGTVRRYYFVCPHCGRTCEKVFLYVPILTMIEEVLGKKPSCAAPPAGEERQFMCRVCLGLRYESEEASEKGSNLMRRWFLRKSGGVFTEREYFEYALGRRPSAGSGQAGQGREPPTPGIVQEGAD